MKWKFIAFVHPFLREDATFRISDGRPVCSQPLRA